MQPVVHFGDGDARILNCGRDRSCLIFLTLTHSCPIESVAETLYQEVDEDTSLHGEVACGRIQRAHRELERPIFCKDALQLAQSEVRTGNKGRQEGDAAADDGGVAQHLGVIGAELFHGT
jgi:hypothetical protein